MAKVSVIVPTRCRPQLVGRAIESILAQTFPDFEILLVDNNPPERRIVRNLHQAPWLVDPRLHLLEDDRPQNAGAASVVYHN